jgi:hypothetical protein
MTHPTYLQLAAPRAPAQVPRRRPIAAQSELALRALVREALSLPLDAQIKLEEWISRDSRGTPHTLHISVEQPGVRECFVIAGACERLAKAELFAAIREHRNTLRLRDPR